MPTQIESAKICSISSLDASSFGKKIRVVGRLLSYDAAHALVILLDSDGKHTAIVDVQGALDDSSNKWVTERLSTVIVMGYVEESPEELPDLETDLFSRGILHPPSTMVIRAILVLPAEDLDLKLWDSVAGAEKPA